MPHLSNDELPIAHSPQRVSGMKVPDELPLPTESNLEIDTSKDAWRQTGFLMKKEWNLIQASLNLSTALVKTGYTPSARSMIMAGYASVWSRSLLTLSDAAGLVRGGSYQTVMPLIRQSIELAAAHRGLTDEIDEWKRWTHEAFAGHAETKSTEIGIGGYFAGSVIAEDPVMKIIYRASSDFARPNFGPTSLFVANEASHEKHPLHFADRSFHLGWTQLLFGWILSVSGLLLETGLSQTQEFPADNILKAKIIQHLGDCTEVALDEHQCRLKEWTDSDNRKRYIISNFKRQSTDAAVRLLI
ncbi:MAG TPA: hypothetical protein EYQ00_06465 [Dehalococcoidia bacterium]|nr:hypothetical protein [Dehalococcoidia bacterium]